LPDGRTLETLADLRAYILELPAKQQQEPLWQNATAQLLKAAELANAYGPEHHHPNEDIAHGRTPVRRERSRVSQSPMDAMILSGDAR